MYKNTYDFINKEYEAAKAKADANQNRISLSYSEAHMRLIKFSGQTGTIFVGGDSELSCKCLKDAVDDAVLACRSAYEHGYIRGLNLETLSAITKLSNELAVTDTQSKLKKECLSMFFDVFEELAINVMYNKYADDDISREDFVNAPVWNNKWVGGDSNKLYLNDKDINTPKLILYACIENNYEYNIVTEQFAPAGFSVVNSVSTDIEVIKATTSILSLLLSSNQLISINRQFDRDKSIEEAEKRERKRYANIADGIMSSVNRYLPIKIKPMK
jgi:chaperonin GroEL (HSP60 family)